jgi:hypothetical protein
VAQVASLEVGLEYNAHFGSMFKVFMGQLQLVLPPGTDIVAAYNRGTDEEQAFVQNLALFLTAFFKVGSRLLFLFFFWGGAGGVRAGRPGHPMCTRARCTFDPANTRFRCGLGFRVLEP